MKKALIIIGIILLVIMAAIYAVFDFFFPKAEKFDYPDYSNVQSITVIKDNQEISLSDGDTKALYEYISKAKPTRIPSIQDSPGGVPYYTIFINAENISPFGGGHIYEEGGVTYYELPYVGIYVLDANALRLLETNTD